MTGEAPGRPAALVPPHPNLGPEPFPEPGSVGVWPWLTGLALAAGLFAGLLGSRRRRRATARARGGLSDTRLPGSPAGGVVALAEAARAALVARFGEPWRTKTTEEIAADPAPAGAFGVETAATLIALLGEADRLKFSGGGSPGAGLQGEGGEDWAAWVAGLVAGVEAGARSTINEK